MLGGKACFDIEQIMIPAYEMLITSLNEFKKLYTSNYGREDRKGFMPVWDEPEFIPPHTPDLLEYAEWIRILLCERLRERLPISSSSVDLDRSVDLCIQKEVTDIFKSCYDKSKTNNVIDAIGNIIQTHREINTITYNYDCLLEKYFEDRSIQYQSIFSQKTMYSLWDTSQIKIYHVHGRIPVPEPKTYVSTDEKIILTENDYYEMERYAYDWINAVQAERIHRKDMIIVGFSAQDFNFKRILKNIKKPDGQDKQIHVIFLPVEDVLKDISYPSGTTSDIITKSTQKMAQNYIKMKSKYLQQYGIHPIWTCYEELPNLLKGLI